MDEKRMNELIEIEKKHLRYQAINKLSYKKRNTRIRLERERYAEGVKAGVIEAVTDEEVKAMLNK